MEFSYKFASLYGYLAFLFTRKQRNKIHKGLSLMYGDKFREKDLGKIARYTFENSFKVAIEVFWYPKFTAELTDRIFIYQGLENIEKGLTIGNGIILLFGHFGSVRLIIPAIGNKGYKLNQLVSRNAPKNEMGDFENLLNRLRYRYYKLKLDYKDTLPAKSIYSDKSVLSNMYRCLRNNEILAFAIDGREGLKKVELDFLGQKAIFSTGGIKFLEKTQAAILPTFMVRQRDGKYRLIIESEIKKPATLTEDNYFVIKAFLSRLEYYVKQYPCHYAEVFYRNHAFFK